MSWHLQEIPGMQRKRREAPVPWSEADLALLLQLVRERLRPDGSDDDVDWKAIAGIMGNRTTKQCREKYRNDLRPGISKTPFSPEEDFVLALAHSKLGNKWSDIAQHLPRRAENTIKNRWYTTQRTRDEGRPKTFLWLYSALSAQFPDMDVMPMAKQRWSELAATSNGRMLPLSEFEVAVDHFTTGAGAAQVAALIKAEMAAAALLVPGSMTIHSATARAAANSASSVLAMPLALRAASAHLHATFAAHTVRVPLVAGAAAFDAELARGATEPGDAEPGGAAVTRGSCMPSDGYHWQRVSASSVGIDIPSCSMCFACQQPQCPARKSAYRTLGAEGQDELVVTYFGADHTHPAPGTSTTNAAGLVPQPSQSLSGGAAASLADTRGGRDSQSRSLPLPRVSSGGPSVDTSCKQRSDTQSQVAVDQSMQVVLLDRKRVSVVAQYGPAAPRRTHSSGGADADSGTLRALAQGVTGPAACVTGPGPFLITPTLRPGSGSGSGVTGHVLGVTGSGLGVRSGSHMEISGVRSASHSLQQDQECEGDEVSVADEFAADTLLAMANIQCVKPAAVGTDTQGSKDNKALVSKNTSKELERTDDTDDLMSHDDNTHMCVPHYEPAAAAALSNAQLSAPISREGSRGGASSGVAVTVTLNNTDRSLAELKGTDKLTNKSEARYGTVQVPPPDENIMDTTASRDTWAGVASIAAADQLRAQQTKLKQLQSTTQPGMWPAGPMHAKAQQQLLQQQWQFAGVPAFAAGAAAPPPELPVGPPSERVSRALMDADAAADAVDSDTAADQGRTKRVRSARHPHSPRGGAYTALPPAAAGGQPHPQYMWFQHPHGMPGQAPVMPAPHMPQGHMLMQMPHFMMGPQQAQHQAGQQGHMMQYFVIPSMTNQGWVCK